MTWVETRSRDMAIGWQSAGWEIRHASGTWYGRPPKEGDLSQVPTDELARELGRRGIGIYYLAQGQEVIAPTGMGDEPPVPIEGPAA